VERIAASIPVAVLQREFRSRIEPHGKLCAVVSLPRVIFTVYVRQNSSPWPLQTHRAAANVRRFDRMAIPRG